MCIKQQKKKKNKNKKYQNMLNTYKTTSKDLIIYLSILSHSNLKMLLECYNWFAT